MTSSTCDCSSKVSHITSPYQQRQREHVDRGSRDRCFPLRLAACDGKLDTGGATLFIHVSVFVSFHLRQTQDCILTFSAVVMSLLAVVRTPGRGAVLGRGELLKSCSKDAVQLLMLSSMSHNFVCVCAVVITL